MKNHSWIQNSVYALLALLAIDRIWRQLSSCFAIIMLMALTILLLIGTVLLSN